MTRGQFEAIIEALTPSDGQGFYVELTLATGRRLTGALHRQLRTQPGVIPLEVEEGGAENDRARNCDAGAEVKIYTYIDVEAIIAVRGPIL